VKSIAATLLPERLWDLVEPFSPTPSRRSQGGRPRVSDRACLSVLGDRGYDATAIRRGLRVQYDKWGDLHEAFLSLGCAMICWQSLRKTLRWTTC
jgi:transposase